MGDGDIWGYSRLVYSHYSCIQEFLLAFRAYSLVFCRHFQSMQGIPMLLHGGCIHHRHPLASVEKLMIDSKKNFKSTGSCACASTAEKVIGIGPPKLQFSG